MFIPFEEMPGTARIWVCQSNRLLSDDEVKFLESESKRFAEEWTAHSQRLHASAAVLHKLFLVLAADESQNDASGCSIDKSVRFVRQMERQLNNSFLDRLMVAFRIPGGTIEVKPAALLAQLVSSGNVPASTTIFSNNLFTKSDLNSRWEIPFSESWVHEKYLPEEKSG